MDNRELKSEIQKWLGRKKNSEGGPTLFFLHPPLSGLTTFYKLDVS